MDRTYPTYDMRCTDCDLNFSHRIEQCERVVREGPLIELATELYTRGDISEQYITEYLKLKFSKVVRSEISIRK